MTQAARQQITEQPIPLKALFSAFSLISLCGIGGGSGLVWARRILVESRHWIDDEEFADIISLCQFLPGPNIIGIAVCVGAKTRGAIGTVAALCGFLAVPWTVGLSLGMLYLRYTHLVILHNILTGIAVTAAGLLIGAGAKLLMPHRRRPAAFLFATLAFGLVTFARLPLIEVLFGLVPVSIVVAGTGNVSAR
jgi:chromate transporter